VVRLNKPTSTGEDDPGELHYQNMEGTKCNTKSNHSITNMPSTHLSCTARLFCTYDTLLDCLHGNSCVHNKMLLVEDCRSLFVSLLYRFFLLFFLFDLLRLHSFPFLCIAFFPIYACNLFDEMTFIIFLSISICSIFHSNIFTWYQSTSDFFFSL
jgi:hypothetical protein